MNRMWAHLRSQRETFIFYLKLGVGSLSSTCKVRREESLFIWCLISIICTWLVFSNKIGGTSSMMQNRWYLFDDADLLGSGHDEPENAEHWRYLGFNGGYHGDFSEMSLGISELIATYNTLSRYHVYRDGRQSQVERSCMRLMVMLCEAWWCFPFWNHRVLEVLQNYLSEVVDSRDIGPNTLSDLFQSWSKISARLLIGPVLFTTLSWLPRFSEYHMMILVIDVLLMPQLDLAAVADEGEAAKEGQEAAAGAEEGQEAAAEEGQY
jgi:hypothetical protein